MFGGTDGLPRARPGPSGCRSKATAIRSASGSGRSGDRSTRRRSAASSAADIADADESSRRSTRPSGRFGALRRRRSPQRASWTRAFQPSPALTPAECRAAVPSEGGWPVRPGTGARDRGRSTSAWSSRRCRRSWADSATAHTPRPICSWTRSSRRHNRGERDRWLSANWDAWRWTEVGHEVPGAALAQLAIVRAEATTVFDYVSVAAERHRPDGHFDEQSARTARRGGSSRRASTRRSRAAEAAAEPARSRGATILRRSVLTSTQRAVGRHLGRGAGGCRGSSCRTASWTSAAAR